MIDVFFSGDIKKYECVLVLDYWLWLLGHIKPRVAAVWISLFVRHCDVSQSSGTKNQEHLVQKIVDKKIVLYEHHNLYFRGCTVVFLWFNSERS